MNTAFEPAGQAIPIFAPKLVIFDCDGVLIDSEILACRSVAECFSEFGFPLTTEEVMSRFLGRSSASMLAELEVQFGRAVPAEALTRRRQRVTASYEQELRPVVGIVDLLNSLEIPVCVASSGTPEYLDFSLRLVGLYDRFAPNIFSASMVARGKPAPDLFLFAAESCNVAPEDCLVIEDSAAGVTAAVAAAIPVLGFTGGSHCEPHHGEALRAAGAQHLFCDFTEFPRLVPGARPAHAA